jgi:replicative DNA helicase
VNAPAHDHHAEQAVLGAMMLSLPAVNDVRDIVTARDFYQPAHEAIYDAILEVAKSGRPDAVTVAAALGEDLPRLGGATYLHECINTCPAYAAAEHYAEIVRDMAVRRRLDEAGAKVQQLSASNGEVDDLVAQAQTAVAEVQTARRPIVRFGQVADEVVEGFGAEKPRLTPTPWPELDRVIGGTAPGRLYTVAGRPGTGKSVLGRGLALSTAQRGAHALLVSAEMTRDEVTCCLLASIADVPHERIYDGTVNDLEQKRISRVWAQVQDLPLHIDDRSDISVGDIRAAARAVERLGHLGIVVVDYVQLLRPADRKASREQQVSQMSRDLKVLAKELNVPVVMLAQLNREVEKRQDKRPQLSDLRESGSLEQDANVVALLYRDQEQTPFEITVGIGKNRHGKTGPAHLWFNGPFQRIDSPSLASVREAS